MTSTVGDEELYNANLYQRNENVNTQDHEDNVIL